MRDELKIAWRNLWRNKRRTVITSASVFFAVFFAVIMRSYQLGSYERMIMNFIGSYSGYLQIQHVKYQDNPSIDYSFIYNDSLVSAISGIKNVVSVSPHIESFVLASSGTQTKGVALLAIDPEMERKFSNPENKLVKYRISPESIDLIRSSQLIPAEIADEVASHLGGSYSSRARFELEMGFSSDVNKLYTEKILKYCEVPNGFLENDDEGVLVSDRLAGFLKLGIGDTVILLGAGISRGFCCGYFSGTGNNKNAIS